MGKFSDKLEYLIQFWLNQNIKLNVGNDIIDIEIIEKEFTYLFDDDFKTYLLKLDGFVENEWDFEMISFWSVEKMRSENLDNYHPSSLLCFADYSINVCSFGFNKMDRKIYTHFQGSNELIFIADSFSEFVDIYINNSLDLIK